jgi:predicted Zn-dependent protease
MGVKKERIVIGRGARGFGFRFVCAGLVAVLGIGCATTGPGGKKSLILIGDGEERSLGSRMAGQIKTENRFVADPAVSEYVNRVGQRIVRLSDRPGIPYEFSVIESKDVNAFALPGGYIYVYTGLLRQLDTEAQLAGVLGHEISHVVARHGVKQLQEGLGLQVLSQIILGGSSETTQALAGQGLGLLMKGYSRSMEREADQLGILYSTRAGHNPQGMVQVLEKLNQLSGGRDGFWENLSSDHPPEAQRIAAVKAEIQAKGLDVGLPDDPKSYRAMKARLK